MPAPTMKKSKCDEITAQNVAALFRRGLPEKLRKNEAIPTECQCSPVATAINTVRSRPAKSLNESPAFKRRRSLVNKFEALVQEQLRVARPSGSVRLPGHVQAEQHLLALQTALTEARSALLAPYDPLAGQRKNASWHKAARYLAPHIEGALKAAGFKTVSWDKRGRFIGLLTEALALAGFPSKNIETVASALENLPE